MKKYAKLEVWAGEKALGFWLWALGKHPDTGRQTVPGLRNRGGETLPQPAGEDACASTGLGSVRLEAGWPFKMVFTTIITHEFSGGPWTFAVQGPK